MRLAVYNDSTFSVVDGRLHADEAVVAFNARLADFAEEVVMLGRLDPAASAPRYAVREDVRFVALPNYASLSDPLAAGRALVRSLGRFRRALDTVDAVWLHGPHPLAVAFALVALARRRRVVLAVRQDLPAYARRRHPGRAGLLAAAVALEAAWRALALVCPVAAVGPDLARRYRHSRELLALSISLVEERDVVDPRAAAKAWDGDRRILSVGRLDAEKNPLLLADVLAALRREDDSWRLIVCGTGDLAGQLAERLEALGVAAAAELRGYVAAGEPLWELYRSSHVLLHVSWTEGVPQILFEAWAAGVPVVATSVGGVAAVAEGAALLIGPGDAPAAARAIERVAADAPLREHLVARGNERVAGFTAEAQARALWALIAGG